MEYEKRPVDGYTKAGLLPKAGVKLVGTYEGYYTGGKFNSTNHYLILSEGEVKAERKDENGDKEQFKAKPGDKISISGAKKLNDGLQGVTRGSTVEINFTGWNEFTTKKGESAREALFEVSVLKAAPKVQAVATEAAVSDVFGQ